jgi:hypothetical protein
MKYQKRANQAVFDWRLVVKAPYRAIKGVTKIKKQLR